MSHCGDSSASPPPSRAPAAKAATGPSPLPRHPTLPLPSPTLRPYSFVSRTPLDIAIPTPSPAIVDPQSGYQSYDIPTSVNAGSKRPYIEEMDSRDKHEDGEGEEGDMSPGGDEKGGNGRLLKQTKRAAQNRAAQQAFRKRKEERIKELEEKESLLNHLAQKEKELDGREACVSRREKLFAAPTAGAAQGPTATVPTEIDLQLPLESIFNCASSQMEKDFQTVRLELIGTKQILSEKVALIDSLRRSLEDLGAENHALRSMIGRHGLHENGDGDGGNGHS